MINVAVIFAQCSRCVGKMPHNVTDSPDRSAGDLRCYKAIGIPEGFGPFGKPEISE